jgi:hypothetical protein
MRALTSLRAGVGTSKRLSRNGQEENGDREEDHRETDRNPQQSEI